MTQNKFHTNSQVKNMVILRIMFVITLGFSLILPQTAISQEILVQTGFEDVTLGEPPQEWDVVGAEFQVTDDTVKNGNKSFAILGGANDNRAGVVIETENPIISVEFWAHIKGAGRSFNLKVVSADEVTENNGGVYINWNENATRLYDGSAWVPIDAFQFDTWKYVRVVADVSKSQFDYYVGDDRDHARTTEPKAGLSFRNDAVGPVAKWVVFHVYSTVAEGYIDDLLIYEGGEPPSLTPVNPKGKLATFWGHVKKDASRH